MSGAMADAASSAACAALCQSLLSQSSDIVGDFNAKLSTATNEIHALRRGRRGDARRIFFKGLAGVCAAQEIMAMKATIRRLAADNMRDAESGAECAKWYDFARHVDMLTGIWMDACSLEAEQELATFVNPVDHDGVDLEELAEELEDQISDNYHTARRLGEQALPEVPHFYGNPAGPVFTISYKSHKVIKTFKQGGNYVDPVYWAYKVVKRSKSGRITKVVHMRRFRKTPP